MVAHITTVAFQGINCLLIDVQVQLTTGLPAFSIVGLPDKTVAESRERVRGALAAIGLALPAQRITINLSPADVLKEGSHYDLPIALGLLTAIEVLPADALSGYFALGELGLDARLTPVAGILPAAMAANLHEKGLICPARQGQEAAWAGDMEILAADELLQLINHLKGQITLSAPQPGVMKSVSEAPDLKDIKGQENARHALEIAACGGHNMLMSGPPGSGKSMLAQRLPGILPPMDPAETLEVSTIYSIAGLISEAGLSRLRPFRDPHHSTSVPALVGGGQRAKPGEISLGHNGVLFLDELPEFSRNVLEALRQPLETGRAVIARVNAHVTYPSHFQLIAAMNPCRCGDLDNPELACSRAPKCALDYQARISGPLFDRIDLHIDISALTATDLTRFPESVKSEGSAEVAKRVAKVRKCQLKRYSSLSLKENMRTNAQADGQLLEKIAPLDHGNRHFMSEAVEKMNLSARGFNRVLRVARTLADMGEEKHIHRHHLAEALSYRRILTR